MEFNPSTGERLVKDGMNILNVLPSDVTQVSMIVPVIRTRNQTVTRGSSNFRKRSNVCICNRNAKNETVYTSEYLHMYATAQ